MSALEHKGEWVALAPVAGWPEAPSVSGDWDPTFAALATAEYEFAPTPEHLETPDGMAELIVIDGKVYAVKTQPTVGKHGINLEPGDAAFGHRIVSIDGPYTGPLAHCYRGGATFVTLSTGRRRLIHNDDWYEQGKVAA